MQVLVLDQKFWLFGGTGDLMNLSTTGNLSKVQNVMFGIKDYSYPFFGSQKSSQSPDNFLRCKNTTKDQDGSSCPDIADRGWFINSMIKRKL